MTVELKELPFDTDAGFGSRARIGLVVLENDQTVEAELASLWPKGVAAFATRIPMEDRVTAESLLAMETRIPEAAGLLPEVMGFDVIGYGCTSAATLIGEERVSSALHRAHPEVPNTNPISAVLAAMEGLGARRIAVVTPYNAEVTTGIVSLLEDRGLDVAAAGSFLEESDANVARITEASVAAAVREMVANCTGDSDPEALDAVFVSCTSLRAYGVAADLEAELGVAVISSNLAFGWHLLRLAGIDDDLSGLGRLFSLGLER